MIAWLYVLVPVVAALYASVGFGGATGYLMVMSLFDLPPQVMASTALLLNILVAGVAFVSFHRAGHLRHDLLVPFLVTSLPAAFLGGFLKISDALYMLLLYLALTFVAVRLIFFSQPANESQPLRPVPPVWAGALGLGIGLLSGMVGIGGGIFLSPVIILARWGYAKQASAVAAGFIVANSLSGLLGRMAGGTLMLDGFALSLVPLGIAGALLGSYLGTQKFSGLSTRRTLGVVVAVVVVNYWWSVLR